jgi:hypothetical protein
MIDSVPLIQNANDAQQINASIIAMKKASRELDEKIVKLNSLNSELDKKIALLDSGLNKEIEDRKEAINSLDVSSVGGSGKYISAISETDGKISATASDITSSVSSGNSQPVTSGGVANAIAPLQPIDSVTNGNLHPVTSNAVANVIKNYNKTVVSFFDENMAQKINTEFSACANYSIFYFGSTAGKEFGCYGFKHNNTKGGVCIVMSVYYGVMIGSGAGLPSTWNYKYIITP